jgi:SAM-dependent methyltransferase
MAERHRRCRALWRKHYAHVPTREALLDEAILPLAREDTRLLDAGCGPDFPLLHRYASRVAFAAGVDLVEPTDTTPAGSCVVRGDLVALPFAKASFDLVVSRSVVEHLPQPLAVFRELNRVLKPGGKLVFTTPNRLYYSSIVARAVPYRWKDAYMHWVFGTHHYDHFPVYYRANTRPALRRIAAAAGFRLEAVQAVRHFPYYFLFSPMLFRLGMIYDWIVTGVGIDAMQSNWLVVMERC